jgi:hypothetical protein
MVPRCTFERLGYQQAVKSAFLLHFQRHPVLSHLDYLLARLIYIVFCVVIGGDHKICRVAYFQQAAVFVS